MCCSHAETYNASSICFTSGLRFILAYISGPKNIKVDEKARTVERSGRNRNHANAITLPDSPADTARAIVEVAILASGCKKVPTPKGRYPTIAGIQLNTRLNPK